MKQLEFEFSEFPPHMFGGCIWTTDRFPDEADMIAFRETLEYYGVDTEAQFFKTKYFEDTR